MAKKRRQTNAKRRGGTLFGIMLGLILGLVCAVAVALFVTKAPMPFADKASRDPAQILLPEVKDAPDPNLGLRSGNQEDLDPPTIEKPESKNEDDVDVEGLDNLIANLAKTAEPSEPQVTTPKPEDSSATQTEFYLQAGAFKSARDAESVRARILLLGLPVEVQQAEFEGSTINRVRVGPFTGIDPMNQARSQLGAENIETSVVRP